MILTNKKEISTNPLVLVSLEGGLVERMIEEEFISLINESGYFLPKATNFNKTKSQTNLMHNTNENFMDDDIDLDLDKEARAR